MDIIDKRGGELTTEERRILVEMLKRLDSEIQQIKAEIIILKGVKNNG
jgi:hypothetical protein